MSEVLWPLFLLAAVLGMGLLLSIIFRRIERGARQPAPRPPEPKRHGNKSGHMPHQGKREMARRARRMDQQGGER